MRRVNIRRFNSNMYDEIKDLPLMVVKKKHRHDKKGKPAFIVQPIEKSIFDDPDEQE